MTLCTTSIRFIYCSMLFLVGVAPGHDSDRDNEIISLKKEVANTMEINRELIIQSSGDSIQEAEVIGKSLHDYQYKESSSALSILSQVIHPDSDSDFVPAVLSRIKLTNDTLDFILRYAAESNSTHRAEAFIRLSFAPLVLELDSEMRKKIMDVLSMYENSDDLLRLRLSIQARNAKEEFVKNLERSNISMEFNTTTEIANIDQNGNWFSWFWFLIVVAVIFIGLVLFCVIKL